MPSALPASVFLRPGTASSLQLTHLPRFQQALWDLGKTPRTLEAQGSLGSGQTLQMIGR